jgi:hypothetical protein
MSTSIDTDLTGQRKLVLQSFVDAEARADRAFRKARVERQRYELFLAMANGDVIGVYRHYDECCDRHDELILFDNIDKFKDDLELTDPHLYTPAYFQACTVINNQPRLEMRSKVLDLFLVRMKGTGEAESNISAFDRAWTDLHKQP